AGGDEGQPAAVATDLGAMRVIASTPLPGAADEYGGLLPDASRGRLFAYQIRAGALHEANFRAGEVLGTAELDGAAPTDDFTSEPGRALALRPDDSALYAVIPSGGIGVFRPDPIQLTNRLATGK